MITVHYLENSRAHRILWMLEELGLDYTCVSYVREHDMRAPASLKALHPLGKSPLLEDDGVIYAESGAIIDDLLARFDGDLFIPARNTEDYRLYRYWMHYAEGSAMTPLLLKLLFGKLPSNVPLFIRPVARLISPGVEDKLIDPQLKDHVNLWEGQLSKNRFFAGDQFSAADIMMSFPVETAMTRADAAQAQVAIRRYLTTIRARPAYQRALARGGAYLYSIS
jgi:glutathione S-transferase